MAAFKKRLEEAHPALWKGVDATIIRALYVRLYPTVEKVAEMLETSEEYKLLDYCHDRVFGFLRRFVRSLSKEKVPSFLVWLSFLISRWHLTTSQVSREGQGLFWDLKSP